MKGVRLNQCARIEYTLKLEDKTVVDSNVGGGPLTYIHGSHQIIPGIEMALEGMKIGDIKEVTVRPEEGYGPLDVNSLMEVNAGKTLYFDVRVLNILEVPQP